MKTISIILGTIVGVILLLYVVGANTVLNTLGVSNFEYDFYTGVTSATSSAITVATSSAIYSGAGFVKTKVEVCNTTANPIDLYFVSASTATTTGMTTGLGVLLEPFGLTTSTVNYCRQFTNFNGDIRAISSATSTVRVNYSR